jgi:hypothetical protein
MIVQNPLYFNTTKKKTQKPYDFCVNLYYATISEEMKLTLKYALQVNKRGYVFKYQFFYLTIQQRIFINTYLYYYNFHHIL